jgi:hypothetical protein
MLWFNEKKAKSVNFVEDDAPPRARMRGPRRREALRKEENHGLEEATTDLPEATA